MKKPITTKSWLWQWHYWAGIISLPFMAIFAISGFVYLFYKPLEVQAKDRIVKPTAKQSVVSYEKQLQVAQQYAKSPITSFVVPSASSTQESVSVFESGRFSSKRQYWVDPYTAKVTKAPHVKDGWMRKVRELHGSLWLGKVGNLFVECIASWFVVLILTGCYLYFPKCSRIKYLFKWDFSRSKAKRMKNLHSILGVGFSVLFLLVLAGAFPWTTVSGWVYKKVQYMTHSGYPLGWRAPILSKEKQVEVPQNNRMTFGQQVLLAQQQALKGTVYLSVEASYGFTISNKVPSDLQQTKRLHFSPTGVLLQQYTWQDLGIMMRARYWLMAFHQGQLSTQNWYVMALVAIALFLTSLTALLSLVLRPKIKSIAVPSFVKTPPKTKCVLGVLGGVIGVVLPLFLGSVLLLWCYDYTRNNRFNKINSST